MFHVKHPKQRKKKLFHVKQFEGGKPWAGLLLWSTKKAA